MLNASKLEESSSSDVIPRLSWIKNYTRIFIAINNDIHSRFTPLVVKVLSNSVSQKTYNTC